jgi:hypothetical protein
MSERNKSPLAPDPQESLDWLRKRIAKIESELAALKEREAHLAKRAADKNQPTLFLLDE